MNPPKTEAETLKDAACQALNAHRTGRELEAAVSVQRIRDIERASAREKLDAMTEDSWVLAAYHLDTLLDLLMIAYPERRR